MKIVDCNEPWEERSKLIETGWESQKLCAGDFCFEDCNSNIIGIERKEVNDFLNSINSRLDNQLERMLELYKETILLLEGSWQIVANKVVTQQGITNWVMSDIWNYLQSWQRKGVMLQLTSSNNHTIRRVNELYAYYQKPYHLGAVNVHNFVDDRILAFPSGCRGKLALKVLQQNNLQQVANMTIEELNSIDGIGNKKAELIYNHFRRGS